MFAGRKEIVVGGAGRLMPTVKGGDERLSKSEKGRKCWEEREREMK